MRLGFGPHDWDLGLETGMWASRLGFEGGMEKEKDKIPHMCESIGHRPLWGRCPITGRPRAIPGGQKKTMSSKDHTWSAVPDALLGVISAEVE